MSVILQYCLKSSKGKGQIVHPTQMKCFHFWLISYKLNCCSPQKPSDANGMFAHFEKFKERMIGLL